MFYGNEEENHLRNLYKRLTTIIIPEDNASKFNSLNQQVMMNHLHHKLKGSFIFRMNNDLRSEFNHVIKNYFQIGVKDHYNFSIFQLIDLIWGRLFFYELRTVKQLGYVVWSDSTAIDGVLVKSYFNN